MERVLREVMREPAPQPMSHAQKQAARRASTCRACVADGLDTGAFERGIAHTRRSDCYAPGNP